MEKNYYATLGVNPNASTEEIKAKFRKLALKFHPDKNPHDKSTSETFIQIKEAYDILIDPEKRLKYDYDNGFKIKPKPRPQTEYIRTNSQSGFSMATVLGIFVILFVALGLLRMAIESDERVND